ncbi:hypothetical protein CWE13_07425 [Aliidiomarina shirensis]|uniref:Uncharacterized protein n=1 Tax=Aliidiomarina shirensis TaxID=1048642 RepID=A0A432WVJ4_9GAMM|nr:hypothetical protein [Aliidiomarina shirensis]RUO37767.1 hypothetical protein CWE13_07425 [Aliidiomarina shirensis]
MQYQQSVELKPLKINELEFIELAICPAHQRILERNIDIFMSHHSFLALKKQLSRTKVIKYGEKYFAFEHFFWLRVLSTRYQHLEFKALVIEEGTRERTNQRIVLQQINAGLFNVNARLLPEFIKVSRGQGLMGSHYKMKEWAEILDVSVSSLYHKHPPFITPQPGR